MSTWRGGISSRGSVELADESPDVVVIGAGAIGLATAWELARRGARVTVVERGSPGRGATWAAAGMLSPLGEASREPAFLALASASLDRYAAFVEALESATGIDLEYRTNGKLYAAFDESERPELDEMVARGDTFGVERLDREAALKLEPALSSAVIGAVLVNRDHRIDNRRLGSALAAAAAAAGVEVRTDCAAQEIGTAMHGGRRVLGALTLEDGSTLSAGGLVVTAGAWSGELLGLPHPLPVRPVRGQMFAVRRPEESPLHDAAYSRIERVVMTGDCYLIPRESGDILVGATVEDVGFSPGPTPCGIRSLIDAAVAAMPAIGALPIVETWAGFRPCTPDALPILSPDPDLAGVFYATGHFRNGILLAPITAEITADLIAGQAPQVSIERFAVERFR